MLPLLLVREQLEGGTPPDVLTTYRMEQTSPHVYSSLTEHLGSTNVILFMTGRNSVCAILKEL